MSNREITKVNNLEVVKQNSTNDPKPTPILFIHGAWHGAWCWENFQPYFAEQGFSSFALSLRGHAGSGDHDKLRWSSIKNYVADVDSVIDQMETKPILIGHSMGGFVLQKYLENNDFPAAVLLASVPPKGVFNFVLKVMKTHPLIYLKAVTSMNLYHLVGSENLANEFFFSDNFPGDKLSAYFQKLGGESFRVMFDLMFLDLPSPKKVKTPMLVLGAEKDQIFTKNEVEDTASAYHTKAEFFDMAHDVMLEDGWQAVADRIINWLK